MSDAEDVPDDEEEEEQEEEQEDDDQPSEWTAHLQILSFADGQAADFEDAQQQAANEAGHLLWKAGFREEVECSIDVGIGEEEWDEWSWTIMPTEPPVT